DVLAVEIEVLEEHGSELAGDLASLAEDSDLREGVEIRAQAPGAAVREKLFDQRAGVGERPTVQAEVLARDDPGEILQPAGERRGTILRLDGRPRVRRAVA